MDIIALVRRDNGTFTIEPRAAIEDIEETTFKAMHEAYISWAVQFAQRRFPRRVQSAPDAPARRAVTPHR